MSTSTLKKIALPVPGFGFKAFLIALAGLWLLGLALNYLAQTAELLAAPGWVTLGLQTVSWLSGVALTLLVGFRLWGWLVKLGNFTWNLLASTETVEIDLNPAQNADPETAEMKQTISGLARTLADLETDGNQASLLILDARQKADILVGLAQTVARRAEEMHREAEGLQNALTAIEANEPLALARAAGQVKDEHIRDLLLCNVQMPDYWSSLARLTATQLGTLEQWAGRYNKFVETMLSEISQAKTRLTGLTASLEMAGAIRPMLQVQANLDEAGQCLRLAQRPEVQFVRLPITDGPEAKQIGGIR